ncbi:MULTISPECIES: FAD-dependent oxidoreductase [unclassified Lysobacter]|uniref:FAD-dependent oxidoreductase n=1 Tax=unclassified Lysobacter TaxID=2635362 RepID=UPI001BEABFE7|nr:MULTISPECIES: FAD-dependent oxidoreductase [unclassified Lysobacter]MBT2745921.1 FAD-dependent oxidoreductase [Lysobacter sp. ISL-42]MBT2749520.1 FAD-dependent oxidoreductase [Lysobacter sp. ISL-50]MBT2778836.1 FAD-dependent oxidoreductase [Lysobacter sp. ISL-54]MBT2781432.1 FAD-dependent oxidoreductase [Lysobacter sp. ISL-52]
MSRREMLDIVVVGAGVVGAAAALAFARDGFEVALVEAREPAPWSPRQPDLRVYAFAPDNAALLDNLGVWPSVRDARAQPYRTMRVWDAAGGGELHFDADAFGRRELGWIVEHGLLVDRLWSALPAAGVQLYCPDHVEALELDAPDSVGVVLAGGRRLRARLLIAADGADSRLRELAGIQAPAHDYGQRGLVAYVDSELSHEATCWQRFLPSGPLAFLPVQGEDGARDRRSSIVWTLPAIEADRLLALDEDVFANALERAFAGRLGALTLASKRAAFPLRRQLADRYVAGRVVVAGDAAHVVHPLAGQGVNLGLRDIAGLRETLAQARKRGLDPGSPTRLARWARERRSENALAAYGFDGLNKLFSNDDFAATMLRGPMLGLAGRLPPLTHYFWRRAAGL